MKRLLGGFPGAVSSSRPVRVATQRLRLSYFTIESLLGLKQNRLTLCFRRAQEVDGSVDAPDGADGQG